MLRPFPELPAPRPSYQRDTLFGYPQSNAAALITDSTQTAKDRLDLPVALLVKVGSVLKAIVLDWALLVAVVSIPTTRYKYVD